MGHVSAEGPSGASILAVVGLRREARIIDRRARVVVGAAGLDAALAQDAEGIISFGLCGGLDPKLAVGDLVIGDGVITRSGRLATDPAWAARLAAILGSATRTDFAASNAVIDSAKAKSALRAETGAGAVDMESHFVAEAAMRRAIPFVILRAVSDPADRTLPPSALAGFRPDGASDILAVLSALVASPFELPARIRTALDAGRAYRSLERAALAAL